MTPSAGAGGGPGLPGAGGGLGLPGAGGGSRLPAGLCDSCRHQQLVPNTRGSVFSLCLRSRSEPDRFPRYPRVPVTDCEGFERPPDSES